MTPRFVTTPLDGRMTAPAPRIDRLDPSLIPAFVPSPALDAGLARLRSPDAVVITTGQQPGLFTGPLYTIFKALSAAALARALEQRWRRPVVPVFWLANDDHDFVEASHASWINQEGALVTGALPPRPADAPLTPMYRQLLGSGAEEVLGSLAADLPASEFRDGTLDWLGRHYRAGATAGDSFAGAMAELLAPMGIICFDGSHLAAKRAAAPHLMRALEAAADIERDLDRYAESLGEDARTSGVSVGGGASLVMLEASLGRDRLIADGTTFVTRRSHERFTLDDLERIAEDSPTRLSANVLLRPVVESALFPTVAYLGGPGELRYFVLTPPVYHRLGVRRQQPLPRWSGILVEARVDRVLSKFGLRLPDLMAPPGSVEARLVREQLPEPAVRALASMRDALEVGYGTIGAVGSEIDPTLVRPVQGALHHALAGLQDTERKLVQHLKRRQDTELGQLARARTAVYPNQKPQERVLTVAPFLARYGPSLLQQLAGEIEHWYVGALEGLPKPS